MIKGFSKEIAEHYIENQFRNQHDKKSYVTNCTIKPREDQEGPMFESSGEYMIVRLDRYAVIPIEEYEKLKDISDGSHRNTRIVD